MQSVGNRVVQQEAIEGFVRKRPAALLYESQTPALLDVFSGKSLPIDWGRVARVAEARNSETGAPYLVLLRDDGKQVLLADVGVAFAPSTAATGPLSGLPEVVCFRDFSAAEGRLTHYLVAHPDEPLTRTHLELFSFLLAVLDGARDVGFDVAREERRLEALLSEIENRRNGSGSPGL